MKRKRIIIIIIIFVILIGLINHDKIQFFYYYLKSYSNNTKNIIEKDYHIQVTIMMHNKNNNLYEGIDKETLRKKYIIKVSGKGVFTLYADDGVDISNAQIIAEGRGYPSTPINFYIKESFSEDIDLEDCLFWYVMNNQGKILYISFKDGAVTYSN